VARKAINVPSIASSADRYSSGGWRSRSSTCTPSASASLRAMLGRDLIMTMSRENRLWGTERIRGELLKLGIVVSNRSIRRYRWRGPRRPSSQWACPGSVDIPDE
jgi:hypothetical protein